MTRAVKVGNVVLGGGNPIVVQSMTNAPTTDIPATVDQIRRLVAAGCEVVRVAVPGLDAAAAIREIKREVTVPIVADIHYDHRLALAALAAGADKLRLNPGNIRDPDKIREVAVAAGEKGVPIRVGVNAGSVDARFKGRDGKVTAEGLVEAALWEVRLLEDVGFRDIVISIKAHDVHLTVDANRRLAREVDYPLHLGITEAGTPWEGAIRSAVALGILLSEGIGDTIRVSLSGDPVREVAAAWEILSTLGLRRRGPSYVVCPTCGRTGVDIAGIAQAVRARLAGVVHPLTIAIMGCPVNGLGEAERADFAILGGQGHGTVYAHGKVVLPKVPEVRLVEELVTLIRREVKGHEP
ncbi:MAG: flavodoxin-dependent (E)-4-hydroxy-3-methylbut-2-enyl-diphosphate synthase [Candidatus Acetothermia bacterium]|jgi:(E)-4-hydroxy-3-methylbut-2-enyl-diphosphate synthase|nr:flavodoxin-dependent (E)-4-hydroxy-3-methylbut-2-enyl-diphosphate synthase [Candidatus Acetothermia bacterium]